MNQSSNIVNIGEHRPIVKADIENGYDRLAHALTNVLMVNPANLTAREMQVVFAIISKTYRYQKKEDWIANSQICDLTKLSKGHVSNLIKSLLSKNVIYKKGRNTGINSTVSEWKVHNLVNGNSSQPSVPKFTTSCEQVHNLVNKSTQPCETHKKETYTQEIYTKENICTEPKVSELKSEIVFHLPLNKNGTFYPVTKTEVASKQKTYPAVRVQQEYLAMTDWLQSNPSRRKTSSGVKAFVTRWLSKRQNNPTSQNPHLQDKSNNQASIDEVM